MRQFALAIICLVLSGPVCAQTKLPTIAPIGVTVSLPQSLDWLDAETFAVGRWDGSIALFKTPSIKGQGPAMISSAVAPSGQGIEMLGHIDGATLASSDGADHLAVWRRDTRGGLSLMGRPSYDSAFGAANSSAVFDNGANAFLLTGHTSGYVIIWRWSGEVLHFIKAVDVRSKAPASNPYGIHNIRAIKNWRQDIVVTGSEDGDIVGLKMPEGTEVFRVRYNAGAKFGINSISVFRDLVILANCADGSSDKNVWLYDLSSGTPKLLDSENLEVDQTREQTFDFGVALTLNPTGDVEFFASTEEGLLWKGKVDAGHLINEGIANVSHQGGAAIAISPNGSRLATASGETIQLYSSD